MNTLILLSYTLDGRGSPTSFEMMNTSTEVVTIVTKSDDLFEEIKDAMMTNKDLAKGDKRKASWDDLCDAFRLFQDEVEVE